MKGTEIGKSLVLAVISMAAVYGWFALVGVTDLGSWNHGLRNMLAGVICVLAAEWVTGRNLFHPSWRPGLIIFYLWLFVFSYIGVKSGGTWGIRVETLNNDVLTLMPVLVFTFLLEYIGSIYHNIRIFLQLFNSLLIGYLSLSVFVYMTYYKIFGAGFTSTDMISVLLTNGKEAMEFLQSHLGFGPLVLILAVFAAYMALIICLVIRGSKIEAREITYSSRVRKIIVAVLVLASFVTIAHWIPRIFPAWPYHVAHKYLAGTKDAISKHDENLKHLQFTGPVPKKLSGTVILIIGESANRDHMKAFNLNYPVDTTPWLAEETENKNFYLLKNTYSCYPLTEKALSMYLTNINQYNDRSRDDMITLTDVANKIGYNTWFISNQAPSPGNMALALVSEASRKTFTTIRPGGDDMKVLEYLKKLSGEDGQFIVIHLEGSHDRYKDRVPPNFKKVHISGALEKINDYDFSIQYTDEVLKNIYQYAKDNMNLQVMVYCSDHGEDMKSFHGDGYFTSDMVRIPCFIYLSSDYAQSNPLQATQIRKHENNIFTNDLIFDLMCGLLNAPNNSYSSSFDISNSEYSLSLNEAVTKNGRQKIINDPNLRKENDT